MLDSIFFAQLFVPRMSQIEPNPTREIAFVNFSCGSSNENVLGIEVSMEDKNLLWSARKRLTFFALPWTFTKYGFSNDRVFVSSGLLKTVYDEVRMYRIMDISLERTLGQKIFGLGTIKFCSADKTLGDFEFKNIKNSLQVKEQLSELIEKQRMEKRVVNREAMYDMDHTMDAFDDDDN